MRSLVPVLFLIGCAGARLADEPVVPPSDDLDRDRDGIVDSLDRCPCLREDLDSFEDDDGCPDPDNDHDRVVDGCDLCPNEGEVYNGEQDLDGCPDAAMIRIEDDRIVIVEPIRFAEGSAQIPAANLPLLDAAAAAMRAYPRVELLEVQGHTSLDERDREALARRRAEAVRDALIQRGVEPDRLVARGYSDTRPIDFQILELGEAPEPPPPPSPVNPCPDGPSDPEPPRC